MRLAEPLLMDDNNENHSKPSIGDATSTEDTGLRNLVQKEHNLFYKIKFHLRKEQM